MLKCPPKSSKVDYVIWNINSEKLGNECSTIQIISYAKTLGVEINWTQAMEIKGKLNGNSSEAIYRWSDIVPQGYLDVTLVSVEHNTKSFKDRRRRVHIMTFNCRYLGVDFRRTVELQNRNVNTWCPKFN